MLAFIINGLLCQATPWPCLIRVVVFISICCRYCPDYKEKAKENYDKAADAAGDSKDDGLNSTNPIRLGLALNYSVFYYEIVRDSEKACQLAKKVNVMLKLGLLVKYMVACSVYEKSIVLSISIRLKNHL